LVWLLIAILSAVLLGGCGTIPDASRVVRTRWYYHHPPEFVGVHGPLSPQQGGAIIHRLEHQAQNDRLRRLLAIEQAIGGGPLVLGNRVTLLKNGPDTYRAMFSAIEGAHNNICLETYIFTDDSIGQKFADELITKQQQGVQVNIIYDSVGSMRTPETFFDRMRASGIRVLQFNPISPWARRFHYQRVDHRDHRKILVIDGQIAFTGGINISGVYSSGITAKDEENLKKLDYWRDTDVEIEGPAAANLNKLFLATWQAQGGRPLPPRDYTPTPVANGHEIVHVLASQPNGLSVIYVTLISAINSAESDVHITDAYFAPDHQMLSALKAAAHRGVNVELLLPSKTDEPLIIPAGRSHYSGLLEAGVKIYEWKGELLHAKTASIDNVWSTVGSSNLDWWSIARDNEINAVILGDTFGSQMDEMFEDDLRDSREVKLDEWRHRPFVERMQEWFAGWMEPLL
jgi:cardiolipin synthase